MDEKSIHIPAIYPGCLIFGVNHPQTKPTFQREVDSAAGIDGEARIAGKTTMTETRLDTRQTFKKSGNAPAKSFAKARTATIAAQ